MARKSPIHYTDELKSEIWNKYKQGDSLSSIARSIDRSSTCIYHQLAPTGGIRPPARKQNFTRPIFQYDLDHFQPKADARANRNPRSHPSH